MVLLAIDTKGNAQIACLLLVDHAATGSRSWLIRRRRGEKKCVRESRGLFLRCMFGVLIFGRLAGCRWPTRTRLAVAGGVGAASRLFIN